jgi:hypothetical protein
MLVQLLRNQGLGARQEAATTLSTSNIFRLHTEGVTLVCLSHLDPANVALMRFAVRRVRRKAPKALVLLGCWSPDLNTTTMAALKDATKADFVASTLRQALEQCVELAQSSLLASPAQAQSSLRPATVA